VNKSSIFVFRMTGIFTGQLAAGYVDEARSLLMTSANVSRGTEPSLDASGTLPSSLPGMIARRIHG
jgi:hypothetical protein